MTRATLLERGVVVDGSGEPARAADVLLRGERILAVGAHLRAGLPAGLSMSDVDAVDCSGLAVAPGFIDVHTHDDAIVLDVPEMTPKLSQGITTVVTGNCGLSVAPYVVDEPQGALTLLGRSFRYPSVAEYARAVDRARPAVNVAPLVGHTTLRFACVGDLSRPADAPEVQAMCALLERCMEEGAIGLSSGLFYAEAMPAPASEVTALARVVARHGGVYTTHMRTEMADILAAMHEASDTAFDAGVPLIISHHKCAGPANWGRTRETLPLIDQLAERQDISMDVYPYVAGSTVLREDLVDGIIDVLVSWSAPHPEMTGRLLASIADEWGVTQREACLRLKPGGACYFQMHEDDVRRVLRAQAQHDRLRRPAARPPPAPAAVGCIPARARTLRSRAAAVSDGAGGAQDDGPVGAQLPAAEPRRDSRGLLRRRRGVRSRPRAGPGYLRAAAAALRGHRKGLRERAAGADLEHGRV